MGLHHYVALIALAVGCAVHEPLRMRTLHLGLCGYHKAQVYALGQDPIASLSIADAFLPHVSRSDKLKVLNPVGVNEQLDHTPRGVWTDPCKETARGCDGERPTMVFFKGEGSAEAYAGSLVGVARTANATLLVCGASTASDAAACFDDAVKNSTSGKVYVVGSSYGASLAFGVVDAHRGKVAALWLITPFMPEVTACGAGLTAPSCTAVGAGDFTPPELANALPASIPVFATLSGEEEPTGSPMRKYLSRTAPAATVDVVPDMPHEFVLFGDWVAEAAAATKRVKDHFKAL